ncbi:MAG: glycoside hydrolase family 31 protein [Kiritimatiellae bacterium]|nr:glycoside hydrolase family 31 protein [Kiritimatiellia bacterium]
MCRRLIICLCLFAAGLLPHAVQGAPRTNGAVQAWAIRTNEVGQRSLFVNLRTNGIAEVTPYAPDVVRVRFYYNGSTNFFDREEVAIAKPLASWPSFSNSFISASSTNFLIKTDALQVEVVFSNRFLVNFKDASGRDLLRDKQLEWDSDYSMRSDTSAYEQVQWPESGGVSNRPTGFRLKAIKEMPADMAFFGLGDEGGPLNRRGRVFQFWTQDTYNFSEFRNPKYTALPFWYGARPETTNGPAFAYGIFFNNPARPVVDLSATNGTYSFEAGDDIMDYFFFGGGTNHTMSAIIDRFSELTGRPVLLPKWGYGFHQSRHSYMSSAEVTNLITTFRTSNIPVDAVYLDIGHQRNEGQPWQLSFSDAFSNMPALVSFATNQGVQLVPIIEPLLTTNDPLHAASAANLRFIKNNLLGNYVGTNYLGAILWLDFSINETRDWWGRQLTNYLAINGFQGIWNDLTEPNENAMPLDTIWYLDGRYGDLTTNDTRKWTAVNRNTYSWWQSRVSYNALKEQSPAGRPFVLSRAAWPGVQAYAIGWSGDNSSTFDHLRYNTRLALSTMISGQAQFGNDVGGFNGDATGNLLIRWNQASVLAPLFRNHSNWGTVNQEPWAFGESDTLFNRYWIQFRYRMMPYLYSLAHQAAANGLPMNVPTAFFFTGDTNTWSKNEYDFMAGTHLLAAPVIAEGETTRSVYLPSGTTWFLWDTGGSYAGGQTVAVPAALAQLPLFSRAGAIIPMGPTMSHVYEFQPTWLDLNIWPGAANSFTLIEDDGKTTNYLAGVVARTRVSVAGDPMALTVTVHAREGTYDTGARDYFVVAHAMSNVVSVTADGIELRRYANRGELENGGEGWAYDTVLHRATAKIADHGLQRVLHFVANSESASAPVFASAYTSMAVAATFNLWNESAQNMQLVGPSRWAYVTELPASSRVEFKFTANNSWGVANWGDNAPTNYLTPLVGAAALNGANIILSNVAAAIYTFQFNETSQVYRVGLASTMDSDGDGMLDAWEYYYGLNPLLSADALLDLDSDAAPNFDEFIADTRPVDVTDYFHIVSHTENTTNGADVSWLAATGRMYQVFFSTNLLDSHGFKLLAPFSNLVGNGVMTITDTNASPLRNYRIGVSR